MRVNVNLNEDLLTKIDEEAKRLNLSRSAFISVCCSCDINAYYREYDAEYAEQKFIEKMLNSEANAKIIANLISQENK